MMNAKVLNETDFLLETFAHISYFGLQKDLENM